MKKILLGEDEEKFASDLTELLSSAGYEVRWQRRGRSVLADMEEFRPDLLIIDVFFDKTDGADGEKIASEVEQSERFSRVPIIVTSAFMSEDVIKSENERRREGDSRRRYLGKGVRPDEILELIKEMVG